MKSIASIVSLLLITIPAVAQNMSHLYIVGEGVPGGIQELTAFPNTQHKFAGAMREGTVWIRNTEEHKSTTYYLKPTNEDSYIVNNGLSYTTSRDSLTSGWTVPFTEEMFRFTVNTTTKTLKGELFRPWNELFIVGGATECGWEGHTFLPMTLRDDDICTYEWTGELRERPEHNEPRRYKFAGQNAWEPKMLHPFTQDEDILNSRQILTNGTADNKWSVTKNGYYHITVDVFRETVNAEFLGAQMPGTTESSIQSSSNEIISDGAFYNLAGQRITSPNHGIYIHNGKKILK